VSEAIGFRKEIRITNYKMIAFFSILTIRDFKSYKKSFGRARQNLKHLLPIQYEI